MKRTTKVAGLMAVAMVAMLWGEADAASVRVRCEARAARSRVSVDGNQLAAGTYSARVTSGVNTATSPAAAAVGDEAEFDFDSNPANVADGAVPIAAGFIASGQVQGEIVNAAGAVVASSTVSCRTR